MAYLRYNLVGGLATVVHYLLLLALVEGLNLAPGLAAAWGAAAGALIAYLGNRLFTFSSRVSHFQALPRFLLVALFGVAVNGLLVGCASARLGWNYLLAQVLASLLCPLMTFPANRSWTFS